MPDQTRHVAPLFLALGAATRAALALSTLCAVWSAAAGAQEFSGRLTMGLEAERKTCTGCPVPDRRHTLETTPVFLVLTPSGLRDTSIGITFEHDTDSDGAFFGPDRRVTGINNSLSVWVRRDLSDRHWARLQAEYQSEDRALDIGARAGFHLVPKEGRRLAGYFGLDRRLPIGSASTAQKGIVAEIGLRHSWHWDRLGAWLSLRAERRFQDGGGAGDETRLRFEPGITFDLGKSPHKAFLWFETDRRRRLGPTGFKRQTNRIGTGVEFDLGNRRELLVGVTFGRERETAAGQAQERARLVGLILEFQTRF